MPVGAAYLWRWFGDLIIAAQANGFAPAVVTWEALGAWSALMRIELEPWEALALIRIGNLRAAIASEKQKQTTDA